MPTTPESGVHLRADAYSSIKRILDAARDAFSDATTTRPATLKSIASDARVGIATLYRHFPNRDALAAAVFDTIYTDEVGPILSAATERSDDPKATLLKVAEQLADIMYRERQLISSIADLTAVVTSLLSRSDELFGTYLREAQQVGNLRADLTTEDIPYLLAMTATAITSIELDEAQRRRYLALLLDALNPAQTSLNGPGSPAQRGRDEWLDRSM